MMRGSMYELPDWVLSGLADGSIERVDYAEDMQTAVVVSAIKIADPRRIELRSLAEVLDGYYGARKR